MTENEKDGRSTEADDETGRLTAKMKQAIYTSLAAGTQPTQLITKYGLSRKASIYRLKHEIDTGAVINVDGEFIHRRKAGGAIPSQVNDSTGISKVEQVGNVAETAATKAIIKEVSSSVVNTAVQLQSQIEAIGRYCVENYRTTARLNDMTIVELIDRAVPFWIAHADYVDEETDRANAAISNMCFWYNKYMEKCREHDIFKRGAEMAIRAMKS